MKGKKATITKKALPYNVGASAKKSIRQPSAKARSAAETHDAFEAAMAPATDGEQRSTASDVKRFIKLTAKKKLLESKLKVVVADRNKLEEVLRERFQEEEIDSMKVDGATVFTREEIWPALVVPDGMTPDQARYAAVQVLIAMGHERVVNYNSMSMRSIVTELDEDGSGELPEPLGKYVKAEHRYRLSARGVPSLEDDDGEMEEEGKEE